MKRLFAQRTSCWCLPAAAYATLHGVGVKEAIKLVEAHLRVQRLQEEVELLHREMVQHRAYLLKQLGKLQRRRRALDLHLCGLLGKPSVPQAGDADAAAVLVVAHLEQVTAG